jgi:hypothetical protein
MAATTSNHATTGERPTSPRIPPAVASLLLLLLVVYAPEHLEAVTKLLLGI